MTRLRAGLCLALLCSLVAAPAALAWQRSDKKADLPPVATTEQAKAALEVYSKDAKGRATDAEVAALQTLGKVRHSLVAKQIAKKLKTNDQTVQMAAVVALANQESKHARKPLLSAFQARPNAERPKIRGAILESLGRLRVKSVGKLLIKVLKDLEEDPHVVKGAVVACGELGEVRALDALIGIFEHDPNDQPENPGPRDPPGSYWRQLWKRWRVVEQPLRETIERLTEQKFKDGKEAREWYQKNKRRLRR